MCFNDVLLIAINICIAVLPADRIKQTHNRDNNTDDCKDNKKDYDNVAVNDDDDDDDDKRQTIN